MKKKSIYIKEAIQEQEKPGIQRGKERVNVTGY